MGFYHRVTQGETLRTIAASYGLPWRDIWNHPSNAILRDTRTPTILAPGDELWIPAEATEPTPLVEEQQQTPCRSGRAYCFLAGQEQRIVVQFVDHRRQALAGWSYSLSSGGASVAAGSLDDQGVLRATIRLSSSRLEYSLREQSGQSPSMEEFLERGCLESELTGFLVVGELDPPSTSTGVQQRLMNLGYFNGPVDPDLLTPEERQDSLRCADTPEARALRCAVRHFQADENLATSGEVDQNTESALDHAYETGSGTR